MSAGGTVIEIKNIKVIHISTKTDNYNNTVCYFKVTDTKAKNKLNPILSQKGDECRLPVWKAEDGEYMLKGKQKYAPTLLVPGTDLTVMLKFKYYCMDKNDTLLQGFYAMMNVMNKLSEGQEEDDI